jgi:hypothetical protein
MKITHRNSAWQAADKREKASPMVQEQLAVLWQALHELRGAVVFSPEVQAMIDQMAKINARFQP